jgi:hypothetical protein
MNCKNSPFYQKWIGPNKWIIVDLIAVIVFYVGIRGTIWWASIDSGNIFFQDIFFQVFSYAFAATIAIALPLLILYRVINPEWHFGLRLVAITIILFFLMIISFGIVNTYFPTAPQYMRDGTTNFIAAVIGGVIALVLDSLLHLRQQ